MSVKDGNTTGTDGVEATEGRRREKETGPTQCSRDAGRQSGKPGGREAQGRAAVPGEDAGKFQGIAREREPRRTAMGPGRPGAQKRPF